MTKQTFLSNILDYFAEPKVSKTEKILLVIATTVYVISPIDLLPGLLIDDIGVVGLCMGYMNWRMNRIAANSQPAVENQQSAEQSTEKKGNDDSESDSLPTKFFTDNK